MYKFCSWYFPYVVKQNFYNMSRTSFSVLIRYIHYSLLQVLCDGRREIVLQWSQRTCYFLACLETSERSDQKNLTPMIFYICSFAPKDVFPCNLSMESFFHLKGAFLGNHAVVLVRKMTNTFGHNSWKVSHCTKSSTRRSVIEISTDSRRSTTADFLVRETRATRGRITFDVHLKSHDKRTPLPTENIFTFTVRISRIANF